MCAHPAGKRSHGVNESGNDRLNTLRSPGEASEDDRSLGRLPHKARLRDA